MASLTAGVPAEAPDEVLAPAEVEMQAATKPSKSGCGRSGRERNSGWNWLATNHGMVAQLDDLDQPAVGRLAGEHHAAPPRARRGSGC